MKKFRTWRSGARSTRSQTQKRKEALLEHAMNSHKKATLWVFINDFTDSDNHAAALVWAKFLVKHQDLKGIYIAEPRHVDLGYYTTSDEFKQIISLVGRLRPKPRGDDEPIKTVLAGNLTQNDIDRSTIDDSTTAGRPLDDNERMLLQRCIKPDKNQEELDDAKEDAIRHAKLLVMDFLSTMKADNHADFDTYIDHKCLDGALESPINLKTHYHEELVFRNAEELEDFKKVTGENVSLPQKARKLRDWYDKSIKRKLNDFENNPAPWQDLKDYQPLFEEMKQFERVIVFGGCSLSILKELLQYDDSLSKKVEYYQQGGTFNPKLNILGNPLNFALNLEAANFVFNHAEKLSKFRLIPTDTTKKLEFALEGLTKWSAPIGLHSLGFYGKVDIWDLITAEEKQSPSANTQDIIRWRSELVSNDPYYTSPDFRAHKVVMADLSAYLISFTDAFKEYQSPQGVVKSRESGVISITTDEKKMELKFDENSSIKALLLDLPKGVNVVLVNDTQALINNTIQTGSSSFKESSAAGNKKTT